MWSCGSGGGEDLSLSTVRTDWMYTAINSCGGKSRMTHWLVSQTLKVKYLQSQLIGE